MSGLLVKGFQDKESPFAEGFIAGCNEFAKEREPDKFKFIERLRGEFGDKTPPEKDRDDKEMDIDI
ncbi:MAG: hypothetical protein IPL65_21975 [Lewinellaceae bacterium]|nr:hypothetical protein [Lewinellaceae bacterium]